MFFCVPLLFVDERTGHGPCVDVFCMESHELPRTFLFSFFIPRLTFSLEPFVFPPAFFVHAIYNASLAVKIPSAPFSSVQVCAIAVLSPLSQSSPFTLLIRFIFSFQLLLFDYLLRNVFLCYFLFNVRFFFSPPPAFRRLCPDGQFRF